MTPAPRKASRQAWPPLLHRVVRTIRSNQLIENGQHLVVAVSGGPDSVALLSLLDRLRSSWRLSLTVAHCNYGLRGQESDEDEQFVAALCRTLDLPLVVHRLNVGDRTRGTSLQAAARDLRYRALMKTAEACGADRIAVGHTADDQAETVMLWMLRGAGLRGLSGMPVTRDGKIIRPLYDSSRQEVLMYLDHCGLSSRQDSSNAKLLYRRNRIRHEVLPALKHLVPSAVQALCRLADLAREDDRFLDEQIARLSAEKIHQAHEGVWTVERAFVQALPLALRRRFVRDLLRRCDRQQRPASAHTVEQIIQAVMKKGTHRLRLQSAQVIIEENIIRLIAAGQFESREERHLPLTLALFPRPACIQWAGTDQTIRVERLARAVVGETAPGPARIVVDAERLSGPLIVRSWQAGDRIYPLGMQGRSKKVQDFFTDLKVPVRLRRTIPVVAAPEGLVWIVGYRQDERWVVTAGTQHCLVLTASGTARGEGAL
jgi:tRNA(Ile)-lysidine synthase